MQVRVMAWLVFAVAVAGVGACASRNGAALRELRTLAKADREARTPPHEPDPAVDEVRQQRVLALLAAGEVREPEAQEDAALVLQHSGLTICGDKLTAVSRDNYLLAHLLAKAAAERGRRSARLLAADALDRWLVFSGKPQKYGTQTVFDPRTNRMVVPPVDSATTDAERARWGVEPLAMFLKRYHDENPDSADTAAPRRRR
ncbi:MAG TPA: hypothetical protein VGU27_06080 [Candidatus Eisenbacteria bacterium]|nr:hypothetical protein [Candidatus Eisenbacteria bacterium]